MIAGDGLIEWLLDELRARDEPLPAVLRHQSRTRLQVVQVSSRWEGRNVWALFAGRVCHPAIIVKADHLDRYKHRLRAEHATLAELAQRDELVGTVPRPLALVESGPRLALVQTGLAGRPLSVRISHRLRPSALASRREQGRVLSWLERFQQDGLAAPRALVGAEVTGQVETVLHGGEPRFLAHVERLTRRWDRVALPQVPGHGDLGPSNCLVDGRAVRVIDWEGGVGRRNPLADVAVFLNHYGRIHAPAGDRWTRWEQSFRRVFLSDDWLAQVTADSFVRYVMRLGLPVAAAEFLLVATLSELASGEGGIVQEGAAAKYWRPFLRIYASRFEASCVARAIG